MKRTLIKLSVFAVLFASFSLDADAQRRNRGRRTDTTTDPASQSTQNNNAPISNPGGKIPYEVDNSAGGGSDTNITKSMRWEGAFEPRGDSANQIVPLEYEHLRWDDALYAEKVWRELDLREKMNQTFRYNMQEDNGDQAFISILLKALKDGKMMAFRDERFTQPMTWADLQGVMGGGAGADTTPVYNVNDPSKIDKYVITQKTFNPKDVMKLRMKEEWVFDRESSRMFCRIVGLCPLRTLFFEGTKRERGVEPMFWIYYPDFRNTLATYSVYNPKNMGTGRMTWEELFEARMFSSYVIKSSLDNPSNKMIAQMMKDPILRLLEGDNIRERMFNFEQDLWSY